MYIIVTLWYDGVGKWLYDLLLMFTNICHGTVNVRHGGMAEYGVGKWCYAAMVWWGVQCLRKWCYAANSFTGVTAFPS